MRTKYQVGDRIGLVTLVSRAGNDERGFKLWNVVCECGQPRVMHLRDAKKHPPTTHIACAKAKWKEREKALLSER